MSEQVEFKASVTAIRINDLSFNGQPVYQQFNGDGTRVDYFSREITLLPNDQGWKFKRWVPLQSQVLTLGIPVKQRLQQVVDARKALLMVPGVVKV